jgi:release factor glutamine methyltransferase
MPEHVRLLDVLTRTERYLRERGVPSPRYEAELLLAHALEMERLQLYLAHDRPMTQPELDAVRPLVRRRGSREPLAWILGQQGFHSVDLAVAPGVLVPRPDTEVLVDWLLEQVPADEPGPIYVADIGCGSGAIGLAVAAERPSVRVYAVDVDDAALQTTKRNVAALGLEQRVGVLRGDLLDAVPAQRPIDYVLSNPPYIPSADIDALQPEVSRYEPRRALDGGPDGLDIYRRLVPAAAARARRGVAVEVGHDQAPRVADLFRRAGLVGITTRPDLAGIARVVAGHVDRG